MAGRFTNIEMRLDDMEAKLDRIVELCSVARPVPASCRSECESWIESRRVKGQQASKETLREKETVRGARAFRRASWSLALDCEACTNATEVDMTEAAVLPDQWSVLEQRFQTLNKVMTTKAAIAQTPKEIVWTLNKARLYRYIPVVPPESRHPHSACFLFSRS